MPDNPELQAHDAHASSSSSSLGAANAAQGSDAGLAGSEPSRSSAHDSRRPSGSGADGVNKPRADGFAVPPASRPHLHSRSTSTSSPSRTPSSPTTELSALDTSAMTPHLDIANYPTQQLLRLLASLLQHIATSNDQLRAELADEDDEDAGREHPGGGGGGGDGGGVEGPSSTGTGDGPSGSRPLSRASARSNQPGSSPTTELFATDTFPPSSTVNSVVSSRSTSSGTDQTTYPLSTFPLFTASKASLSHPSALLVFHARHVPAISIEAYLLRILKYCPTTNEVFLGLLVYFDRMTKLGTPAGIGGESAKVGKKGMGFAIDSFNVHRLVIAGVTVASKFFSDVFYTNSRYAKVGGLPPSELNSLELQFLLLNDFRLRISVDEMQRYGDRLLAYAEEAGEDVGTEGVTRRGGAPDGARIEGVGESARAGRSGRMKSEHGRDRRTGAAGSSAAPGASTSSSVKPAAAGVGPSVQDAQAASTSQPPEGGPPSTLSSRATTSSLPRAPPPSEPPAPLPSAPGGSESASTPRHGMASTVAGTAARPAASYSQAQPVAHAVGTGSGNTYPPPTASTSNPSGATNPRLMSSVAPRGRERDHPASVAGGGGGGGAGDGGVSGGLRDWVRGGEEVMGHVGGRMTSPMRD